MASSVSALFNTDDQSVHVYEFNAWSRFLFPMLCNQAIRIQAKIRQSNTDILKRLVTHKGYFLFHLNLTKTAFFFQNKDELLTRLQDMGITSLNGDVNDTSKKHLQGTCEQLGINSTIAAMEGDPDELLIVKTNFNYGGKPERRLLRADFRRLNLGSNDYSTDIMYPVMDRRQIQHKVWQDENLIVEKYIANTENHFYRVYKLLDRIVISEVINIDLIKKMTPGIKRTNFYFDLSDTLSGGMDVKFSGLIEDIGHLCRALNLDYAAIDAVRSDEGRYYIIDVNLTPNWNTDDHAEILHFLAEGLYTNTSAGMVKQA